jgi:hypothetical protein
MNKPCFRFFCIALTLTLATWMFTPAYAATAITVSSANKVVTLPLRRSAGLNTTLGTLNAAIFVESANKIINIRAVQPPAALVSLYVARFAAIFVESADKIVGLGAVTPATPLRDTYSTIKKRIIVIGADHVGLNSVVPIILDGGVPTGTAARAALLPAAEPSSTPTPPVEALLPSVTSLSTPEASETPTPAP